MYIYTIKDNKAVLLGHMYIDGVVRLYEQIYDEFLPYGTAMT